MRSQFLDDEYFWVKHGSFPFEKKNKSIYSTPTDTFDLSSLSSFKAAGIISDCLMSSGSQNKYFFLLKQCSYIDGTNQLATSQISLCQIYHHLSRLLVAKPIFLSDLLSSYMAFAMKSLLVMPFHYQFATMICQLLKNKRRFTL